MAFNLLAITDSRSGPNVNNEFVFEQHLYSFPELFAAIFSKIIVKEANN